jgi:hypothetical protein
MLLLFYILDNTTINCTAPVPKTGNSISQNEGNQLIIEMKNQDQVKVITVPRYVRCHNL